MSAKQRSESYNNENHRKSNQEQNNNSEAWKEPINPSHKERPNQIHDEEDSNALNNTITTLKQSESRNESKQWNHIPFCYEVSRTSNLKAKILNKNSISLITVKLLPLRRSAVNYILFGIPTRQSFGLGPDRAGLDPLVRTIGPTNGPWSFLYKRTTGPNSNLLGSL